MSKTDPWSFGDLIISSVWSLNFITDFVTLLFIDVQFRCRFSGIDLILKENVVLSSLIGITHDLMPEFVLLLLTPSVRFSFKKNDPLPVSFHIRKPFRSLSLQIRPTSI